MIALPSDVAHGRQDAKRAFETVFRAMAGLLERDLQNSSHLPATTAQAIAALCVGGMVIARAIHDRALADELRNASMAIALKLGGWEEKADSAPPSAAASDGKINPQTRAMPPGM